jgi:hypothetical protein
VASGTVPQVVVFVATPSTIDAGSSTKLCWQITGATAISITPGVGTNLNANDCATVSPSQYAFVFLRVGMIGTSYQSRR